VAGSARPGVKPDYFQTETLPTLQRMIEILDRNDVLAARERLSKGYGNLRLVK
jgi:hypothetical protein